LKPRVPAFNDGPEGLSLSEVAHQAGVNRGTAYQHFETRDKLIKATAQWVSDKLFLSYLGIPPHLASAVSSRSMGGSDGSVGQFRDGLSGTLSNMAAPGYPGIADRLKAAKSIPLKRPAKLRGCLANGATLLWLAEGLSSWRLLPYHSSRES